MWGHRQLGPPRRRGRGTRSLYNESKHTSERGMTPTGLVFPLKPFLPNQPALKMGCALSWWGKLEYFGKHPQACRAAFTSRRSQCQAIIQPGAPLSGVMIHPLRGVFASVKGWGALLITHPGTDMECLVLQPWNSGLVRTMTVSIRLSWSTAILHAGRLIQSSIIYSQY